MDIRLFYLIIYVDTYLFTSYDVSNVTWIIYNDYRESKIIVN